MDEVLDSDLLGSGASVPVPPELLARLQGQLQTLLAGTADPAAAAMRLQRFIAAARSPTALLAFFERDENAVATLVRLLGTGSRLANQLIADPESFDLIRASGGADVHRDVLVDEIAAELDVIAACGGGTAEAVDLLRAVAGRERLRIAYAEFVGGAPPDRVAAQLTILAEAILESALQFARHQMVQRYGVPRTPGGQPAELSIIGLGALGGAELGYDTPLELMFLCDLCGPSDGAVNLAGEEYFARLCQRVLALVRGDASAGGADAMDSTDSTQAVPQNAGESQPSGDVIQGALFHVSLARRPLGEQGPMVMTLTEAHRHYHFTGRTWERILHLKSRVVAGDPRLGSDFLALIHPWVYRKYLERADEEGLLTLTRKFARRLADGVGNTTDAAPLDVRSCIGGLDDIELIVNLLQVINAADRVSLRVRGTLPATQALLEADCLTVQEAALLSEHYRLLMRYEHCRQVDAGGDFSRLLTAHVGQRDAQQGPSGAQQGEPGAQQHTRPETIAWNLGYRDTAGRGDADQLREAARVTCSLNTQTIRGLLADAVKGIPGGDQQVAPETELILDPEPEDPLIAEVMAKHSMGDPQATLGDLQRLAGEPVPFLSSRRCRHFLAGIAPALLSEVSRTPDPHQTLRTLADVSDSLGGKAVIWELLGSSPAALQLFVRLCACSPYLTGILIRYPGMIDELVDSLILDRLPSDAWLEAQSIELCRGTTDTRAVLQNFKNGAHLQIGVRDCLGKEPLEATHAALAATAACILRRVAEAVHRDLAEQYGDPVAPDGRPVELVMLALGKLGAREPNYHSELDVLFLYTDDCQTQRRIGGHRNTTSTANFFAEAATRITGLVNEPRESVRLLPVEAPFDLAAPGAERRGAISLDALATYFRRGQATLQQRLALCKARAISAAEPTRRRVEALVRELVSGGEWYPAMAEQIRDMRLAMEASADADNLKRAAGGTVDVELITQTLQLCHSRKHPEILVPGTIDALARIADAGLISAEDAETLVANYRTLREVESKVRLLDTPQRHEIPSDPLSLQRLAFLLQRSDSDEIVSLCRRVRASNRQIFDRLIDGLSSPS